MTAPAKGDAQLADGSFAHLGSMPGWHVVADLTPPELIAARRLKVVRLLMLVAVLVVAAVCAGGYYLAEQRAAAAADELAAVQEISSSLQAEQREFAEVTALRGSLGAIRGQVAALLAGDVDFSALLGDLESALPDGMTIGQASVTILPIAADGTPVGTSSGAAAALDASGVAHIGTVALSGSGQHLDDLSVFIRNLSAIDGVLDPYPLANQATDTGTTYSVQLTVTEVRLSHAFDVEVP